MFAGNETQQETLLPSQVHRGSFRDRKLTPPPLKTDSVEMENIMVSLLQGDQKYNYVTVKITTVNSSFENFSSIVSSTLLLKMFFVDFRCQIRSLNSILL